MSPWQKDHIVNMLRLAIYALCSMESLNYILRTGAIYLHQLISSIVRYLSPQLSSCIAKMISIYLEKNLAQGYSSELQPGTARTERTSNWSLLNGTWRVKELRLIPVLKNKSTQSSFWLHLTSANALFSRVGHILLIEKRYNPIQSSVPSIPPCQWSIWGYLGLNKSSLSLDDKSFPVVIFHRMKCSEIIYFLISFRW